MKTIKLNTDGDIDITDNTMSLIEGNDEIDQRLFSILSTMKGEWFLNDVIGLSHENIITKLYVPSKIELDVIEALRQDERVTNIISVDLSFDRQERKLTINFKAETTEGIVEGEVIV